MPPSSLHNLFTIGAYTPVHRISIHKTVERITNYEPETYLGILVALVLIVSAVSLGAYAYNMGVAHGLAQSEKLAELPPGAQISPYPYYYGGPFWFYRPFGFGFFGCFGPLLFLLLIFFLFRGLWWGGRCGYGPGWRHGHWGRGIPPAFEEWHRQAHHRAAEQTPPSSVES